MNINGSLFRNEESTLILLSRTFETWQKTLRNPWAQLISMGQLWPHKTSGLSPWYPLDFGAVALSSNLFQRQWGHRAPPLGLSTQISALPVQWEQWFLLFLFVCFAWNDFPDCTQLSSSNTCNSLTLPTTQLPAREQDKQSARPNMRTGPSTLSPPTGGKSVPGSPTLQLLCLSWTLTPACENVPYRQKTKEFPDSRGNSLCNIYALVQMWVTRFISAFLFLFQ